MLNLQERFRARYPALFSPQRARLANPVLRGLAKFTRLDRCERFVADHPHLEGLEFVEGVLRFLDVRYRVDDLERQRIPTSGACVIVANHPLGGLDALALLKLVGDVRRDVKIVANDWLWSLAALRSLLLPVRVFGGRANGDQISAIDAALEAGQAVIVFPAAEVSRLTWRGIRDKAWRAGFVRFASRHQAPVIPVDIAARNSILFYAGAAIASPVGTAMLPRELFAGHRRIDVFVGRPLDIAAEVPAPGVLARQLQAAAARLRGGVDRLPQRAEAVAHPHHAQTLQRAIATLPVLGETPDGKRMVLAQPGSPCQVLREVARLREATFRAVGEGSGQALDWDRYDAHYDQLILWDDAERRIAGAYRLGRSACIVRERGIGGLYTASLFAFDRRFDRYLEAGLELGRSFVVPDYWGTRSLDYLWFGIGAYLRRYPHLRYLFGTVSISAALPAAARDALVAYYARYYGNPETLAIPSHPYPQMPTVAEQDLDAAQAFAVLKQNLARLGARVPTLYKQYTELCEPGGAQFLAFGIDPQFQNAVDGLILVDLQRVVARKRQRYLEAPSVLA
jgi:putative hemolysin